jgi:hypothetical protein
MQSTVDQAKEEVDRIDNISSEQLESFEDRLNNVQVSHSIATR